MPHAVQTTIEGNLTHVQAAYAALTASSSESFTCGSSLPPLSTHSHSSHTKLLPTNSHGHTHAYRSTPANAIQRRANSISQILSTLSLDVGQSSQVTQALVELKEEYPAFAMMFMCDRAMELLPTLNPLLKLKQEDKLQLYLLLDRDIVPKNDSDVAATAEEDISPKNRDSINTVGSNDSCSSMASSNATSSTNRSSGVTDYDGNQIEPCKSDDSAHDDCNIDALFHMYVDTDATGGQDWHGPTSGFDGYAGAPPIVTPAYTVNDNMAPSEDHFDGSVGPAGGKLVPHHQEDPLSDTTLDKVVEPIHEGLTPYRPYHSVMPDHPLNLAGPNGESIQERQEKEQSQGNITSRRAYTPQSSQDIDAYDQHPIESSSGQSSLKRPANEENASKHSKRIKSKNGDRPFKHFCTVCNKGYHRPYNLRNHENRKHAQNQQWAPSYHMLAPNALSHPHSLSSTPSMSHHAPGQPYSSHQVLARPSLSSLQPPIAYNRETTYPMHPPHGLSPSYMQAPHDPRYPAMPGQPGHYSQHWQQGAMNPQLNNTFIPTINSPMSPARDPSLPGTGYHSFSGVSNLSLPHNGHSFRFN